MRELTEAPAPDLAAAFGPATGPHLARLGRGARRDDVDDSPWVARAHGHEMTYQEDLTERGQIEPA